MNLKELPSGELSKISTLLKKDKNQDDISWMYNPPKTDTEAYLLGKEVTSVDQIEKLGQDYDESPAQRLARIDMEAKFREDPLTVMKQREAEKRIELLRNTAKVKKLRRLLTMQKHMNEKKRKQRHSDKRRKRSRSDSSSSSSEDSSGDELLDKFIKIVRQSDELEAKHREHTEPSSPEKKPRRDEQVEASRHKKSSETSHRDRHPENSRRNRPPETSHRYRSPETSRHDRSSEASRRDRPSDSYHHERCVEESRSEKKSETSHRDKLSTHLRHETCSSTSRTMPRDKPKLSREEVEARRLQMMNDAKEHAKDRSMRAIHHYRQKEEIETKEVEALSRHGASFIRQMKNDHAQRSTIEDSIHRKASTRQRGELSSNFLKR